LRSSGLDELPQLINVLFGEMSLVGPRPCLPYECDKYLSWYWHRFDTLPGLTGLWQVNGKNNTTFAEMMQMDIDYACRKTLWLDLLIMLKTPLVILSQIGELIGRKLRVPSGWAGLAGWWSSAGVVASPPAKISGAQGSPDISEKKKEHYE
jgi:hypothetical protein